MDEFENELPPPGRTFGQMFDTFRALVTAVQAHGVGDDMGLSLALDHAETELRWWDILCAEDARHE